MKVLLAFAAVLLLGAACADALTVQEAVQQRLVGCPDPSDFNACLTHVVDSVRAKVIEHIIQHEGDAVGTIPKQQLGPVTLSGSGVTYSGLDTIKISEAQLLDNDILAATLNIGHIDFDGDMLAKLPIIGEVKAHLNVKVKNLVAKLRLHLAVEGDKLLIKKVNIKITTDEFAVSLNNGAPLTRPDGSPLPSAINNIVQGLIKSMNNKSILEKRILPMGLRMLMPFIRERINILIDELPKA